MRDESSSWAKLAADGTFRLNLIPARELELRVGAVAELAAGQFTSRQTIQVEAGGTTRADFDL